MRGGRGSSGIAGKDLGHPAHVFVNTLKAPEAATGEHGGLKLPGRRGRVEGGLGALTGGAPPAIAPPPRTIAASPVAPAMAVARNSHDRVDTERGVNGSHDQNLKQERAIALRILSAGSYGLVTARTNIV